MARNRLILGLALLLGLALGARTVRASDEEGWKQCWPQPGIEPPGMCSVCFYSCFGDDYLCCPAENIDQ
jgi:hypothetical protein